MVLDKRCLNQKRHDANSKHISIGQFNQVGLSQKIWVDLAEIHKLARGCEAKEADHSAENWVSNKIKLRTDGRWTDDMADAS